FAQFVVDAIARGTKWSVVAPRSPAAWEKLRRQIRTFLTELRDAGAFSAASSERQAFLVICDERINDEAHRGRTPILIQYAPLDGGGYHTNMTQPSTDGTDVRPVTVNRFGTPLVVLDDLEREIKMRFDRQEYRRRMMAGCAQEN